MSPSGGGCDEHLTLQSFISGNQQVECVLKKKICNSQKKSSKLLQKCYCCKTATNKILKYIGAQFEGGPIFGLVLNAFQRKSLQNSTCNRPAAHTHCVVSQLKMSEHTYTFLEDLNNTSEREEVTGEAPGEGAEENTSEPRVESRDCLFCCREKSECRRWKHYHINTNI